MSIDETTESTDTELADTEPIFRIDPDTGNKVISLERNGETL
jgi:hypothetical protein